MCDNYNNDKGDSEEVNSFTIWTTNHSIPIQTTYYHCQAYSMNFNEKIHITRLKPRINYENKLFVHHILLFLCPLGLDDDSLKWSGDCYSSYPNKITPNNLTNCEQVFFIGGWAFGGKDFIFPAEAGFPLNPGTSYFLFQIHYNNMNLIPFIDSVGYEM